MLSIALPAVAHSSEDIETWLADWEARIPADGLTLDDPLMAELADFIDRHPEHFDPRPKIVRGDSPTRSHKSPTTPHPAGVEQWRSLVAAYFAPDEVETALCIMAHESGGNPNAKNPNSSASGLFQHLKSWWDYFDFDPFIPEQSIRAAKQLKDLYGWSQWSPYKRGRCRGL